MFVCFESFLFKKNALRDYKQKNYKLLIENIQIFAFKV